MGRKSSKLTIHDGWLNCKENYDFKMDNLEIKLQKSNGEKTTMSFKLNRIEFIPSVYWIKNENLNVELEKLGKNYLKYKEKNYIHFKENFSRNFQDKFTYVEQFVNGLITFIGAMNNWKPSDKKYQHVVGFKLTKNEIK